MKVKSILYFFTVSILVLLVVVQGNCSETIKVTNVLEFVNAIGSNRVIELSPGEYNLTDVSDSDDTEHVYWTEEYDGNAINIKDVENLKIVGQGEEKVRIIANARYVDVMTFTNSEDIELVNLEVGHFPKKGGCVGGVINLYEVRGCYIKDSVLFGCGTEGLTMNYVLYFDFENSVIRDCNQGIMTVSNSSSIYFRESEFLRNIEYYGAELNNCSNVEFHDCIFNSNITGSTWSSDTCLIRACDSIGISLKGGEVKNNIFHFLTLPENAVDVIDVEQKNNQEPYEGSF